MRSEERSRILSRARLEDPSGASGRKVEAPFPGLGSPFFGRPAGQVRPAARRAPSPAPTRKPSPEEIFTVRGAPESAFTTDSPRARAGPPEPCSRPPPPSEDRERSRIAAGGGERRTRRPAVRIFGPPRFSSGMLVRPDGRDRCVGHGDACFIGWRHSARNGGRNKTGQAPSSNGSCRRTLVDEVGAARAVRRADVQSNPRAAFLPDGIEPLGGRWIIFPTL